MIQTWAVILIVVLVSLGILIWAVQKWKKYKRKYFTDDPNDDDDEMVDLEALELTLDDETIAVSRNLQGEMEEIDHIATATRGALHRTNSF